MSSGNVTITQLQSIIIDILKNVPYRPFFCLPLSALLYAILKDNYKVDAKLAAGDLLFDGSYIFKCDFLVSKAKANAFQEWQGHAWVELEDLILDLSFFRTVYSPKFTKSCKNKIIQSFGEGRGCLIGTSEELETMGFIYKTEEYLSDQFATGIIQGVDSLP